MLCEQCGAEMPEGVTVCSSCGHVLQAHGRLAPEESLPFVPEVLTDDPISGDGSAGRRGVDIAPWRLHTLSENRLESVTDPSGEERADRQTRHAHERSRQARTEGGRTRRRNRRAAIAALITTVIAGIGSVGITYALELWGGKSVPNVVGLSRDNAIELIEAKGLVVQVESEPSDAIEGHAVAISPAGGTRVEEGSSVLVTIGESRHIPEVVGLKEEDALLALQSNGAENVRLVSRTSFEPEGTVIEVRPAAGSVFMSTDEVVVAVSQLPRMIDLVGEEETVALAALERAEIPAHVVYERGSAKDRQHVMRTNPEVGGSVGEGGATLTVGDPLIDVLRLSDYFDVDDPRVRDFLIGEGLEFKVGHLAQDGQIVARFDDKSGAYVAFTNSPWSHAVANDKTAFVDVMEAAKDIKGVRLSVPMAASTPAKGGGEGEQQTPLLKLSSPGVNESTAHDVMQLCGFTDVRGACTQDSIKVPQGTSKAGHTFYCCFGEVENCVWTVLIKGATSGDKTEPTEVVVTCAPRSTYATIDLTPYDGRVCDYVAYQDEFVR